MKSSLIILNSLTEANKAVSYLHGMKIKADIEKSTGSGGCTFGIRVYENPDRICRLLSVAKIKCKKIIYGVRTV